MSDGLNAICRATIGARASFIELRPSLHATNGGWFPSSQHSAYVMDSGRIVVAGPKPGELQSWASKLETAGFRASQCNSPARLAKAAEGCDVLFVALYAADAQDWLAVAAQIRNRFRFLKIAAVAVESSEDL